MLRKRILSGWAFEPQSQGERIVIAETELKKGCLLIWRKGDTRHESVIRVTQITKHLVRAVSVTPSAYQRDSGLASRGSFWNPKSFILEECTAQKAIGEPAR